MLCQKEINTIYDMSILFTSVSILYLPLCFFLKSLRIKRNDKYNMHYTIWNLGLALFSLWGLFMSINVLIIHKSDSIQNIVLDTSFTEK